MRHPLWKLAIKRLIGICGASLRLITFAIPMLLIAARSPVAILPRKYRSEGRRVVLGRVLRLLVALDPAIVDGVES